ncbi:hypothetical protein D046_6618B, partial [Vibrio parahaemolyticus V-223/04]
RVVNDCGCSMDTRDDDSRSGRGAAQKIVNQSMLANTLVNDQT